MSGQRMDLGRVGGLSPELTEVVKKDMALAKDMASTAKQQIEPNNLGKGCTPILLGFCFGIAARSKQRASKQDEQIRSVGNVYARFVAEIETKIKFRYDENGVIPGGEDKVAFCISSVAETIFLRPAFFCMQEISTRPEDSQIKNDNKSQRKRAYKLIHEFVHSIGVDKSNHPAGDRDLEAPQQFMVDGKKIKPEEALVDATSYEHFARWSGLGFVCQDGKITLR